MEQNAGSEPEVKKMCALEYDIRNKGENAYYYAHRSKFEKKDEDPNAQTITGPGIITGGDPILLQSEKKAVEIIQKPKEISKYVFYDDGQFVVVKIDLPEDAINITEDCLDSTFSSRSYKLKINVPDNLPYFFTITKLYLKVLPESSNVKFIKTKTGRALKINFAKADVDEEWTKLTA